MRDISKRLTVINTEKKDNASDSKGQSSGVTYVGFGGGGMKNLNDYLLKSIWDRVWEIRTDSQGTEYIFGKLPVVTQYGITMYSGENTDIPTIAEGLPFDNRTIWFNTTTKRIEVIGGIGGGSGEGVSNFWDLSGIPSWITNTKPTYSYSEIQGTPDLSVYALKSDIPSLSGYATEQWVLGKGYALSSDLSKYIPISGVTDITGEKNFTGGLKVNGSPIYYDTEKRYWRLEGDLLVTGGVTMYGNEGTFTPSTIMDAIAVDGTTISKDGGVLKVIGSVGGATTLGSLSNVGSWADSVASKDRIMYQAANSSQWVAKNLSDLAVGGVTGDYLPLSGGILTGDVIFVSNSESGSKNSIFPSHYYHRFWANNDVYVHFYEDAVMAGTLNSVANLRVASTEGLGFKALKFSGDGTFTWDYNTIWHAGNDGSGSGLDADLLDGLDATAFFYDKGASNSFDDKIYNGAYRTSSFKPNNAYGYGLVASFRSMEACAQIYFPDRNGEPQFRMQWNSQTGISSGWTGLVTTSSIGNYQAGSAVKDGNGNIITSTYLPINGNGTLTGSYDVLNLNSTHTNGTVLRFYQNSVYKGEIGWYKDIGVGIYDANGASIYLNNGNVGMGINNPAAKLHVAGDILATGGITMYSARKLKTIQDERGLSLEELSTIKPTRFTWKDGRDDKVHIGGIADDVMKVLPEVIYKTEDDTLTMDYGNAAFAIAASLIKPVVNHEERIKMLEEENKRLKEEVEQLKWNIA